MMTTKVEWGFTEKIQFHSHKLICDFVKSL